jgi:hypothetical protein
MKTIKQIKDFLQKKGNGYLLWGLTICLFLLYSFNKEDISNAWKGVTQLPKIAETMEELNKKHDSIIMKIDTIKVQIDKVDSSGLKRDIILKKDLKQVAECVKSIAVKVFDNKAKQDSILKLMILSDYKEINHPEFATSKYNYIFADTNNLTNTNYEQRF